MRIALINPGLGIRGSQTYRSLATIEPLALCVLAGLTPDDIETRAFDDRFEALPFDQDWDLVAITIQTSAARRAYEIADAFRNRQIPVVLGGFHPTLCPDEAAEHADAVALGEAEAIWPQIVEDASQGKLKSRYQSVSRPAEIRGQPDRSILAGKRYLPISPIEFSRGCSHNCDFCSARSFYGKGVRYRQVDDVLADIAACKRRLIFFTDDNLFADQEKAKSLLQAITPLRLRWICQASIEFVDNPELLDLMVASGCQCVMLGLESIHAANLIQMGKGWTIPHNNERALASLRRHGIAVYASFVFGYDEDAPSAFSATREFIQRHKFFLVNCNHLQPYPGTRLYDRLKQKGRLIYDRWWLDPGYRFGQTAFYPQGMSADELTNGCSTLRRQVHGPRGVASRLLNVRANACSPHRALLFLAANLVSRQDIMRKHNLQLGNRPANEIVYPQGQANTSGDSQNSNLVQR